MSLRPVKSLAGTSFSPIVESGQAPSGARQVRCWRRRRGGTAFLGSTQSLLGRIERLIRIEEEMTMTWTLARVPSLLVLVVGALTLPLTAPAAAPSVVQLATGSGHFQYTSDTGVTDLRTFSFEARQFDDGTVSGNAQVKNRATGQTLNIHVDCLKVLGNIAVVSGIAWSATGPGNTDGDGAIFAVEDNGEGADAAPDRVTYAYTGSGLVCTDFNSAADVNPSLFYDVEGGNIQIH